MAKSPTEQIAALRDMVAQAGLDKGANNSLLKKLENVQNAVTRNKVKVAYNTIGAFRSEVQLLLASQVLTPAQAQALLSAADTLLQSLQVGGGF